MQSDPTVMQLLQTRVAIYDYFQGSSAGPAFFFQPQNADAYAAYYTSMYLIQDTGEAVMTHMITGFAVNSMQAYLEFWGVMKAINIQQGAIFELHKAVVRSAPNVQPGTALARLRDVRHACAGHTANRSFGVPAPQRAFMGRSFGNYKAIKYELWEASTGTTTHPIVDLGLMIADYDVEASAVLNKVLSDMNSKWP